MSPGNKINNLGELTMNMVARNMLIALSVAGTLLGGSVWGSCGDGQRK